MKRYDVEQGSAAWKALRLGKPTASNFDKIITEAKMQPSASRFGYAHQLIADSILGYPSDDVKSAFMERGSLIEHQARAWYEFTTDNAVERVGFVATDDDRCGASPDGLVNANGLLEIKCPSLPVHLGYVLGNGIGYKAQVQGQLWICEREWCDTVSFCPGAPNALVRVYRDDAFIAALDVCVTALCDYIAEARARLTALGMRPQDLHNTTMEQLAA